MSDYTSNDRGGIFRPDGTFMDGAQSAGSAELIVRELNRLALTTRTDAERIKALEHDRATLWAELDFTRWLLSGAQRDGTASLRAATDALPWVRERGTK